MECKRQECCDIIDRTVCVSIVDVDKYQLQLKRSELTDHYLFRKWLRVNVLLQTSHSRLLQWQTQLLYAWYSVTVWNISEMTAL